MALVALPAVTAEDPVATVSTGGKACLDRYWEVDLGGVRVVSPDSCTYSLYASGVTLATASKVPTPAPECMDRYWELDAGDVKVVSRNTCHYEVHYKGEPVGLTSAQGFWVEPSRCVPNGGSFYVCVDTLGDCQVSRYFVGIAGTDYDAVCVTPGGDCTVAYEWARAFGESGRSCYVPGAVVATGGDCMTWYWEQSVGPVTVVSRSSCDYEVVFDDSLVSFSGASSSGPGACMERYWSFSPAEGVEVVSRDTCSYEVYYQGERVGDLR